MFTRMDWRITGACSKRCIKGTHISVEPFHLFRYLDAEAFRFNNRKVEDGDRFVKVLGQVEGKRLTYKNLIGEESRCLAQASNVGEGNADELRHKIEHDHDS